MRYNDDYVWRIEEDEDELILTYFKVRYYRFHMTGQKNHYKPLLG
jgi:hypothetical protein